MGAHSKLSHAADEQAAYPTVGCWQRGASGSTTPSQLTIRNLRSPGGSLSEFPSSTRSWLGGQGCDGRRRMRLDLV